MQHTLLGLGLILIAAIAAALAAPAYVDWNVWRGEFERRASTLIGAPVKVRGEISATLLPTPAFLLNEVEIGGPGGLQAAQVQGILALGPLFRGLFEAEEVVLRRPSLRVTIERDGRLLLPPLAPQIEADRITFQRIAVMDGTLLLDDRASGITQVVTDIRAQGDLRSLLGPFRLDATAKLGAQSFSLRLNGGRFGADASTRIRLAIESEGVALEADGALALAGAIPRFEGRATLALPALRLGANLRASGALVSLENLQVTLAGTDVPIDFAGQAQIEPSARRIEANLSARRIDLDRIAPASTAPRGFAPALKTLEEFAGLAASLPYTGRIELNVENVTAGGGTLRELRLDLLVRPEGLALERLEARLPGRGLVRALRSDAAADVLFAGDVMLEAEDPAALMRWLSAGAISAPSADELALAGRATLRSTRASTANFTGIELDLRRVEGLGPLLLAWLGESGNAQFLQPLAGKLAPLTLAVSLSDAGPGSPMVVRGTARVAEINVGLQAKFDPRASIPLSESRLVLGARETGRIVELFGLAPGLPIPGPTRLELSAAGPRDGAFLVQGQLVTPSSDIRAEGTIALADGRIEPKLTLRIESSDLRPLAAAFARAGGPRPLAAAGTVRLARTDTGIALDDLKLSIGDARIGGELTLGLASPLTVNGTLSIDRVELSALLALSLGRINDPAAQNAWSGFAPGAALFDGMTGAIEFEVERLLLASAVPAENARFALRFDKSETRLEDFVAALGGGKLSARVTIMRSESMTLDGRLALADADLARLLANAGVAAELGGRGALQLAFSSYGRSPAALVAALAGQGVLALETLKIERLDPAALKDALATDGAPPDEAKVAALLATLFARAPLSLAKIEAPLTLAGGTLRIGTVRTSAGPVQVAAQANLDLARLQLDAALELETPAPDSSARPGATVRWRGPLGAPERTIEAAALSNALALKAMEREMREMEKRDSKPLAPVEPPKTQVVPAPVTPAQVTPPPRPPAPPRPAPREEPWFTLPALPPPLDIRPPPGFVLPRR